MGGAWVADAAAVTPLLAAPHVHFVGIAGSGMSALASLLLGMGTRVSGSDVAPGPLLDALRARGATVFVGHAARQVQGSPYVVRSAAVPLDNPEVQEARRRGLRSVKLAEAVGELMRDRGGAGIAGTHGKSTTTALTAWLLDRGGLDPLALIGAHALDFEGGSRLGSGPMVVEADEYDRRFLELSPDVAVVTSIEPDHLDYYRDLGEIRAVFQQFVDKLPTAGRLVVCLDDPRAAALKTRGQRDTYGFSEGATWRASDYRPRPGGSAFTLHVQGRSWDAEMQLVGEHNVRNALAAIAVAEFFGAGLLGTLAALASFRGTLRRFQTKGRPAGIRVIDDYAHHPTAIREVLRAARQGAPLGQVWSIFQPHTSSRTAALMEEFARSFGDAQHVLLLPIYEPAGRAGEGSARGVTSADLARGLAEQGHPDARYVASFDEAVEAVRRSAREGDVVLTMGAGNVTRVADQLARELGAE